MPDVNDAAVTRADLDVAVDGLRAETSELRQEMYEFRREMYEFRDEMYEFRKSVDLRFDGVTRMIIELRNEFHDTLVRTINAGFERFHKDFGILDDQDKAIRVRQDDTDRRVTAVRDDLDAHRADRKLHRRR